MIFIIRGHAYVRVKFLLVVRKAWLTADMDEQWDDGDKGEGVWLLMNSIGFIIFLFFILTTDYGKARSDDRYKCDSPDCARCNQFRDIDELEQRLELFRSTADIERSSIDVQHKNIKRVERLLVNSSDRYLVFSAVVKESGYEKDMGDISVESIPQVWVLPGLTRQPIWSENITDLYSRLHDIKLATENVNILSNLKMEFKTANESDSGWKMNTTPSGQWKIFPLYNQGSQNEPNCAMCPRTVHFLKSMRLFMEDHTFGNALFSVLAPGSRIEPHAGPCNYRLRCHLPLAVPSGFKLRVGKTVSSWEEDKLLIFDDSFIHEVWSDELHKEGRAVLIFDIWHPEVTSLEKAAIKYMFD